MVASHWNRTSALALTLFVSACVTHSSSSAGADRSRLLELHAEVMEAHLRGNVELILRSEPEDYVVASRGDVSHPSVQQRRGRLGPYLSSTRFTEYTDVIAPIVVVSRDGTLGWVIVQVRASGEQSGNGEKRETVAFQSAWIELYEKRSNQWFRVGNVSNFKP